MGQHVFHLISTLPIHPPLVDLQPLHSILYGYFIYLLLPLHGYFATLATAHIDLPYTYIDYFYISVAWITAMLNGLWLHGYPYILVT